MVFLHNCVSFHSRLPLLTLWSTQPHSKLEVVSFLGGKDGFASSPGQQRWYLSVEQSLDRPAYSSLKDWKFAKLGVPQLGSLRTWDPGTVGADVNTELALPVVP